MENEQVSQIGFSDQFSYCNTPIKYEITENNTIQLYVEDCAKALGVTETKTATGNTTVRWNRVYDDLVGIEKIANAGNYRDLDKYTKNHIRNKLKQMFLPIEDIVLWCKKVNTDISNEFIQVLTKINSENINHHIIIKECKNRSEIEFFKLLNPIINSLGYEIINQYPILSYRIDGYIPKLNIAIEYDEDDHKRCTYEEQEGRQIEIEKETGCKFIRVSDDYEYGTALGIVIKYIFDNKDSE